MTKDIRLGDDVQITLCILYIIGSVVSLWMIVLSPFLLDYMGAKMDKRPKDRRDWPKIFLIVVLFQPITFISCAIGLFWVGALAIIPPIHFVISVSSLLAVDFFADPDPWDKEYSRIVNKW